MPNFSIPKLTAREALTSGDTLIDVRKAAARTASGAGLPGVIWIDPFALTPRHPVLRGEGRLLFFCVHGHEVSHYAAALALMSGRDAACVAGGYEALLAAGAKTAPLSEAGA